MRKWIIILIVVGLLGWAIYDFTSKQIAKEEDPEVGIEKDNSAPDFELTTIDGETVKLSEFRGEKILLNFWASWCAPCRSEMPDMQKFHETYDDVVILAVNLTETETSKTNVTNFLDEYEITFPVLMDSETVVANIYNARALPTSYLINSDGRIHNIATGPLNYESMVQEFDKMD
ncbi:redoxin domain-containing protein [Pseudogracilibacillus sp. SE30717A]|uniref:TlpA family protein disulfide reductase n=1 Tax=Pseudogracilibacillus sp. SE30717A TaxID=3098293 RepID=UPI00300DEF10